MSYPDRLLPKSNYKIIKTEALPDNSYLLRSTDLQVFIDSLGKVKVDAILADGEYGQNYGQVFGLSVNLLGIYTIDDKKFQIIDKNLNKLWSKGDKCVKKVNKEQYVEIENRNAIFFQVERIHLKSFPYTKTVDNTERQFQGTSLVEHVPTHGNFWHYQIVFKDINGEIIKSGKSTWIKNLRDFLVKSYLKKFAKPSIDKFPSLDRIIYTEKS